MQIDIDASGTDVIAMNLTLAALDRWLATGTSNDVSGEQLGQEIAALYREIHTVVGELSPDAVEEDDDEDDEEEEEALDLLPAGRP
jgi:hypothetical protein